MSSMTLILRIMKTAIFRFCIVGAFGSLLNYFVFLFCHLFLSIDYRIAGILGFLAPIPIIFIINRKWSFRSNVKKITAMPLYFGTNGIALLAHFLVQTMSHEMFAVSVKVSQLMGIFVTAMLNFYLAKTIVFKDKGFLRQ
jgi:putative flippase GtrA